jgi:hypothetical protein
MLFHGKRDPLSTNWGDNKCVSKALARLQFCIMCGHEARQNCACGRCQETLHDAEMKEKRFIRRNVDHSLLSSQGLTSQGSARKRSMGTLRRIGGRRRVHQG